MRFLLGHSFCFLSLLFLICVQNSAAQCSLHDKTRDALYISYERTAQVKIDGSDKLKDSVILRLHNNSTCAVLITTGSADKFYKPLPVNPTVMQRAKREIDYDLPDGVLVPDLQYRYQTRKYSGMSVGGDMFFGFKLLGNRSVLFVVPFEHLDLRFASRTDISFKYDWEQASQANITYGSVENSVVFWNAKLPEAVQIKIKQYWK